MSAKRVEMHRLQELVRLHRMGTGCRKVANLLKMSPNTEREYRQALDLEPLPGDPGHTRGTLSQPRYARTAQELLPFPVEETHESN